MLVFTDTPAQVPVSLQQQQSLSGAIEEYEHERQVNGPEARQQLQKPNPALVAERDRAVVEVRKERIQRMGYRFRNLWGRRSGYPRTSN
jgi:hypothetical protein